MLCKTVFASVLYIATTMLWSVMAVRASTVWRTLGGTMVAHQVPGPSACRPVAGVMGQSPVSSGH